MWLRMEGKAFGSEKAKELKVHGIGRIIIVDVQI